MAGLLDRRLVLQMELVSALWYHSLKSATSMDKQKARAMSEGGRERGKQGRNCGRLWLVKNVLQAFAVKGKGGGSRERGFEMVSR